MTEAEWLVCDDPRLMLTCVCGRASSRTLRLFAAVCCRRNWHLLEDDYSRRAVDTGEGYADGLVSFEEWLSAHSNATDARCNAAMNQGSSSAASYAARAAFYALNTDECMEPEEGLFAQAAGESIAFAAAARACPNWQFDPSASYPASMDILLRERAAQADLVRCIFGNPFRPLLKIPAAWLTANVLALAQGIYDDREWDRVGILADALQEAGCDAADLLAHLRGPGPHARGCWGVDTILGRS